MKLLIISGGQTGADRGGLDAAIQLGVDHDGWCPKGRLAEDGVIPERYKLRETETREYKERTRRNVDWANVTIIFTAARMSGGSEFTYKYSLLKENPAIVVAFDHWEGQTAADVAQYILKMLPPYISKNKFETFIINVAGSRKSKASEIQDNVRAVMTVVIHELRKGG